MKADTVQWLSALFELYGQKGTATLLMSMKTAMAPSLYCNMPGYSTMEEAVKVAAGASEADAKAELAKLTETFAKWAADAAHKLPAKKTPAAPAVATGQEVKLSCDRDQPLSEGYGGCFKCGSKYHRREDHKDSADGGQKGGGNNNNNSGGGGGKGGKHCKNCGRNNHWTDKCREAVCTKCGATGHWGSNCKAGGNAKDETGKAKSKEPTAPATSTQGEKPEGNKPEGSKYSVVSEQSVVCVRGSVDGVEAKVGLDTFCHPDALFSKEVVKDDELLPSKVLLEGVGADVKPLGQATKHVKLEGGANLTLTGEVLKELPAWWR